MNNFPQKIRIIGGAGCGKSTFAKEMTKKTTMPLIALDHIDSCHKKRQTSREILQEKLSQETWVVEGVQYQSIYKKTISRADVVIFMDYPLYVRQTRLIKRAIQLRLNLIDSKRKCNFSQLISLMKWNKQFEQDRIELENILRQSQTKVIYVKNRSELLDWYNKHLK